MSNYTWFNGQKWLAIQLANFTDDSSPPPDSAFIISEITEDFLITELTLERMITE